MNAQPAPTQAPEPSSTASKKPAAGTSTIPEASERDELTVQEMSEARDLGIKYPVSPAQILKSYAKFLTDAEQEEITEFDEVYYIAADEYKIHATKTERLVNNGYDDADGYYRISKNDQIGFRFQIVE